MLLKQGGDRSVYSHKHHRLCSENCSEISDHAPFNIAKGAIDGLIYAECLKVTRGLTLEHVANIDSIERDYAVAQVLTHDFSPICHIAIEWPSAFRYGAAMTDDDHNRMRWASRRGLLELDLFLADFVADEYPRLSPDLKNLYRELMSSADQDMFEWLMGRSNPDDSLRPIVIAIQDYKRGAPSRQSTS